MPVVALQTTRVAGYRDMVVKGRVYDAASPVVKTHPWLFVDPDEAAARQSPAKSTADLGERSMSARKRNAEHPVEAATAAPGEKRNTRRV